MVLKRVLRTGDGSFEMSSDFDYSNLNCKDLLKCLDHENIQNPVWGCEDRDFGEEDRQCVEIS